MSRDSIANTILVTFVLCVVCSVLVSGAAVGLHTRQELNKELEKKRNILAVAGILEKGNSIEEQFKVVEERIVNIETAEYVDKSEIDPATFDQRAAAKDPNLSLKIPREDDLAGIKRREKYSAVYLINHPDGTLDQVILPVYGKGLWSTLYGFVAVDSDGNTIRGLTFYEQGETPGLGGEVENPGWKKLWAGKKIYENGAVQIEVIKGTVLPESPGSEYKVDGLSGATITSRSVTHLLHYWLGDNGFGPLLKKLKAAKGGQHG